MLPKWWEVYSGDDEKKVFVGANGASGLARNKSYEWRSVDSLVRESGLSRATVEGILAKYYRAGIAVRHEKDPEKWGYWERVNPTAGTAVPMTLAQADQKQRLDKADPTKKVTPAVLASAPIITAKKPAAKKPVTAGTP